MATEPTSFSCGACIKSTTTPASMKGQVKTISGENGGTFRVHGPAGIGHRQDCLKFALLVTAPLSPSTMLSRRSFQWVSSDCWVPLLRASLGKPQLCKRGIGEQDHSQLVLTRALRVSILGSAMKLSLAHASLASLRSARSAWKICLHVPTTQAELKQLCSKGPAATAATTRLFSSGL